MKIKLLQHRCDGIRPFIWTVLFLAAVISCKNNSSDSKKIQSQMDCELNKTAVQYIYYNDLNMWEHIFKKTPAYEIPQLCPASIMIPHHDITTGRQNSLYKAVSKVCDPKIIFIVAPDHFERGKKLITMPEDIVFDTPEGKIEPDKNIILKIKNDEEIKDAVSIQDDLWKDEHGIFVHMPFIKHYFPDAKVVPITVKMLSSDDEFKYFSKLGKVLSKIADEIPSDSGTDLKPRTSELSDDSRNLPNSRSSLLIASVDCSHYQIPCVTAMHDKVTLNTLFNREDPRYAEIDSPESVSVLYSYNGVQNAEQMMVFDHSSTFDYIQDDKVECTSHFYLGFYAESNLIPAKPCGRKQTFLIAGSGKTGAGIRRTWKWDRYKTSTDEAEILLRDAAGKEARFFYGFDALIFDPEPGSVYEQTVHGTTLRVFTADPDSTYRAIAAPVGEDRVNVLLDTGAHVSENEIPHYLDIFDVVVLRDPLGKKDAFMFYRPDRAKAEFTKINLGICRGKGRIKGAAALVDVDGDKVEVVALDYKSSTGVMPAIWQFVE